MGMLTADQITALRSYLENHGLTYEALQTEMLDHICCDVEMYMSQGLSFEAAIDKVKSEIPKNQFKSIQQQTMEAIHKKLSLTKLLKYGSFSILLLSVGFKVLHLPGAGILLMLSFAGFVGTLVAGVLTNPLIKRKETGKTQTIALVTFTSLFLISLCMQMLNMAGSMGLRTVAVVFLIITLGTYALSCFLHPVKVSKHLIMDFIKKDRLNINSEKTLLMLLVIGTVLKVWQNDFLFVIFFMLFFVYESIYYYLSSCQFYLNEEKSRNQKLLFLIVSTIALAMFLIPTLGPLIPAGIRIFMVWGCFALLGLISSVYYFSHSKDQYRGVLGALSGIIAFVGLVNLALRLDWLLPSHYNYLTQVIYSPASAVIILTLFIIFFKKPVFRALVIFTLSMLIFSYQMPGF